MSIQDWFVGLILTIALSTGACVLVKKPSVHKNVTDSGHAGEEQAEEGTVEEVATPPQVPDPPENEADQVRKLQDTKIKELVDQRVQEIKKASSEGFRVYTETCGNYTKAMKLAGEFEKRGFKVQVRRVVGAESYQLVITW